MANFESWKIYKDEYDSEMDVSAFYVISPTKNRSDCIRFGHVDDLGEALDRTDFENGCIELLAFCKVDNILFLFPFQFIIHT